MEIDPHLHPHVTPPDPIELPGAPEPAATDVPFCIGRHEVTVGEYRSCVATGECPPLHGSTVAGVPCFGFDLAAQPARAPVTCVSRDSAEHYCGTRGLRLPTYGEWLAARGAAEFPWGPETPGARACWSGGGEKRQKPCLVSEHESWPSPFGVYDLSGNVWEWIEAPRVVGGSFLSTSPRDLGSSSRKPSVRGPDVGFRCAKSI